MARAIFYTYQTSGACTSVYTHQMEKIAIATIGS